MRFEMRFPVTPGVYRVSELREEAAERFLKEAKRRGVQVTGRAWIKCTFGEVAVSAEARPTIGCPFEFWERDDAA